MDFFGLSQRLILKGDVAKIDFAFSSRSRRNHQLDGADCFRRTSTRRAPCERQVPLGDSVVCPMRRNLEILPLIAPHVGATWIGDFELKVICQAVTAQAKAKFKRFGQSEMHHFAGHDKSATPMEIEIQAQRFFASGPLCSG